MISAKKITLFNSLTLSVNDKKNISELNNKLSKAQNDIWLYAIQDKLRQLNESQKTFVTECLAANKLKNLISKRYSNNCLMLYLLFNIRLPSAFRYIKKSVLLLFSHPKTVKHYLATIKTTCRFDSNFFQLLKK